jgi:hypothetical protein
MYHIWGKGKVHRGFWYGNLRERVHLEDQGVDGRTILRCIYRKQDGGKLEWIQWLRIGAGSRLPSRRQ